MKKATSLVLALVLCMGLAVPAVAAGLTPTFTDVQQDHWAYVYVEEVYANGWISGMGDGTFAPDQNVTYAQMAVMLTNAFYQNELAVYNGATSPWYAKPLAVVNNAGVLKGTEIQQTYTGDGSVNQAMNRYEMAQMLYNVMVNKGLSVDTNLSVAAGSTAGWNTIPSKYQAAVAAAKSAGVISGMDSAGTFGGAGNMTRAQAAVVMIKLNELIEAQGSGATTQPPVVPDNPGPQTPSSGSVVGTMSKTPVTLDLSTHKPVTDYWSTQSSSIKAITDKDAFNALIQSIMDAKMILTKGEFGKSYLNSYINLYYNYAMYDKSAGPAIGIQNLKDAISVTRFGFFDDSLFQDYSITAGNGIFCPSEYTQATSLKGVFAPIFDKFSQNTTDKQKVDICIKEIVDRFDYGTGSTSGFTWLSGTTGTCQNFQSTSSQILSAAGIPNIQVSGNVSNGTSEGAHAWLQAYIDGQWYVVDATAAEFGYDAFMSFSAHEQLYSYSHSVNDTDAIKVAHAIIETVDSLKR